MYITDMKTLRNRYFNEKKTSNASCLSENCRDVYFYGF